MCGTTETRPLDRLGQLGEFEQDSNTDLEQESNRNCISTLMCALCTTKQPSRDVPTEHCCVLTTAETQHLNRHSQLSKSTKESTKATGNPRTGAAKQRAEHSTNRQKQYPRGPLLASKLQGLRRPPSAAGKRQEHSTNKGCAGAAVGGSIRGVTYTAGCARLIAWRAATIVQRLRGIWRHSAGSSRGAQLQRLRGTWRYSAGSSRGAQLQRLRRAWRHSAGSSRGAQLQRLRRTWRHSACAWLFSRRAATEAAGRLKPGERSSSGAPP